MAAAARLAAWGCAWVLVCILALLPLKALAYGVVPSDGSSQPYYVPTGNGSGWALQDPPGTKYGSPGAACRAYVKPPPFPNHSAWTVVSESIVGTEPNISVNCTWRSYAANDPGCQISCGQNSSSGAYAGTHIVNACPTDSSEVMGACVCNSGFAPVNGQCEVVNCQDVANGMGDFNFEWSGNTSSFCYGGCNMTAGYRGYSQSTNKSSTSGRFISTDSSSCQGANNGANGDGNGAGVGQPGVNCPTGQCPGTVNGAPVCVPCSSEEHTGPKTGGSDSEGEPSQLPGAPDGATSKESKTECQGSSCKTTTTYRDAGGNVVGSETTEETKEGFCDENPGLSICKEGSFAGVCASGFTCDGDAVQCAMAEQQHKRACEFFEPVGAAVDAGTQAGTAGDRPLGHPINSPTSIPITGAFDQTNALGGGACPADVTTTVMGRTVTLSYSAFCGPLGMFGQAMVVGALFAALVIVFKPKD